jgi:hypothetical protein
MKVDQGREAQTRRVFAGMGAMGGGLRERLCEIRSV